MGLRRKLRKLIPKEIAGVLEIGAPFAAASVGGPWGAALGATMGGLGSLKRTGKFSPKSMAIGALGSAGPEWGTTREGKGLERFFSKEPSYLKNIWANRADYMPDWLTEERKWLPIKGVEGGEYSIATKLGSMIMTAQGAVGIGLGVIQYIEAKKQEKKDKGLGYTTEDYEADVADYYSAYESSFEKGFAAKGGRAGYDFAKGGIASLKKGGRIGYADGTEWITRRSERTRPLAGRQMGPGVSETIDMDMEWGGPEQVETANLREKAFEEDPLFASRVMKLEAEHERDVSNYERRDLIERVMKYIRDAGGSYRVPETSYWKALSAATEAGDEDVAEYLNDFYRKKIGRMDQPMGAARGGIAGLKKGGRIGYAEGKTGADYYHLSEDEYDLPAFRKKAKEIGGSYWGLMPWSRAAGENLIHDLYNKKYEYNLSMEEAITDLENQWEESIEQRGLNVGSSNIGQLGIKSKEEIREKVEEGWDQVRGPTTDTGIATVAKGGRVGRTKYAFGRGPVLPELLETQEQLPISDILGETGVQVDEQVDYEGPGRGIEGIATEGIERHTASSRIGDLMRLLEEAISKNDFDKANQIRASIAVLVGLLVLL